MSAFVKASAYALQQAPVVNAVIDGQDIVYRDYVDISVAVATPKVSFLKYFIKHSRCRFQIRYKVVAKHVTIPRTLVSHFSSITLLKLIVFELAVESKTFIF